MAVELGWSLEQIREAGSNPVFFEGVATALRVRLFAPELNRLDVTVGPNATSAQRLQGLRARAARERLLRQLRGPD